MKRWKSWENNKNWVRSKSSQWPQKYYLCVVETGQSRWSVVTGRKRDHARATAEKREREWQLRNQKDFFIALSKNSAFELIKVVKGKKRKKWFKSFSPLLSFFLLLNSFLKINFFLFQKFGRANPSKKLIVFLPFTLEFKTRGICSDKNCQVTFFIQSDSFIFVGPKSHVIDAVSQGNWSLPIEWRLECFVIVA